jgi:hypothetical protein
MPDQKARPLKLCLSVCLPSARKTAAAVVFFIKLAVNTRKVVSFAVQKRAHCKSTPVADK